eukprot:269156-Prymnesium_polylepis.1
MASARGGHIDAVAPMRWPSRRRLECREPLYSVRRQPPCRRVVHPQVLLQVLLRGGEEHHGKPLLRHPHDRH